MMIEGRRKISNIFSKGEAQEWLDESLAGALERLSNVNPLLEMDKNIKKYSPQWNDKEIKPKPFLTCMDFGTLPLSFKQPILEAVRLCEAVL